MEIFFWIFNILLSSSFLVIVFFRLILLDVGIRRAFFILVFLISASSFFVLQTSYSWVPYISTILIFTSYQVLKRNRLTVPQSLFMSILTVLLSSFVNYTEQTIVSIIFQYIYHGPWIIVLSNLVMLLLNIYFVLKIPNRIFLKLVQFLEVSKIVYISLISLLLLLLLFISLISNEAGTGFIDNLFLNNNATLILIISVGLFLILISLIIGVHFEEQKNNDRLLRDLTDYTANIEVLNEELSMFRHDYKNLLYSLQLAISSENMEEIKKIYDDVMAPTQKFIDNEEFEIMKLNRLKNLEIKAIVNLKMNFAKQQKISFSLDIPEIFILYPSTDLITTLRLFSVLLDNAIENCVTSKQKKVSVSLFTDRNLKKIVISNSTNSKVDMVKLGRRRFTKKMDKNLHGWGLYYVIRTTDASNQFDLQTTINDHMFTQELQILETK